MDAYLANLALDLASLINFVALLLMLRAVIKTGKCYAAIALWVLS